MMYKFNSQVADAFSVEVAVVLQALHTRMYVRDRNIEVKEKDGRFWAKSSVADVAESISFISPKQIRKALADLEEAGVIESNVLAEISMDRTKWYTITDYGMDLYFSEE